MLLAKFQIFRKKVLVCSVFIYRVGVTCVYNCTCCKRRSTTNHQHHTIHVLNVHRPHGVFSFHSPTCSPVSEYMAGDARRDPLDAIVEYR